MDIKEAYLWLDVVKERLEEDCAEDKAIESVEYAKRLISEKVTGYAFDAEQEDCCEDMPEMCGGNGECEDCCEEGYDSLSDIYSDVQQSIEKAQRIFGMDYDEARGFVKRAFKRQLGEEYYGFIELWFAVNC
ncbi:hypothetical protein NL868_001307 [Shigella flexneri]|nr:hypothetical protein [Shigella flexneri]